MQITGYSFYTKKDTGVTYARVYEITPVASDQGGGFETIGTPCHVDAIPKLKAIAKFPAEINPVMERRKMWTGNGFAMTDAIVDLRT